MICRSFLNALPPDDGVAPVGRSVGMRGVEGAVVFVARDEKDGAVGRGSGGVADPAWGVRAIPEPRGDPVADWPETPEVRAMPEP